MILSKSWHFEKNRQSFSLFLVKGISDDQTINMGDVFNKSSGVFHNSVAGHQIATNFCTSHDSTAVVLCTKFCSDHSIRIVMRVKRNFNQIWIAMEKTLVKWGLGQQWSRYCRAWQLALDLHALVLKSYVPCKNFHMPSHYLYKPCKAYAHCWEK